jgi:hypothetical protein
VVTFNTVTTSNPGEIISAVSEMLVIVNFQNQASLPITLGAQEGFSRGKGSKPSIIDLHPDSLPLIFPAPVLACK